MIYLDTSALIKLYLLEDGSESVNRLVISQDEPLPIWELQEAELVNALQLKIFWGELEEVDFNNLLGHFQSRKECGHYYYPELNRTELLPCFRKLSAYTRELGCRTLDVLHVSCAKLIGADCFVSFDKRQCSLAKLAGLNVVGVEVV
ncbi:MAG: type II toxin-antitoxin system VapC family toxin [Verrucomicrobiae bacterium]|nr:type II toxin-antitoxin system VapC family toxin [Verrucomicrobiae bacterium]